MKRQKKTFTFGCPKDVSEAILKLHNLRNKLFYNEQFQSNVMSRFNSNATITTCLRAKILETTKRNKNKTGYAM